MGNYCRVKAALPRQTPRFSASEQALRATGNCGLRRANGSYEPTTTAQAKG